MFVRRQAVQGQVVGVLDNRQAVAMMTEVCKARFEAFGTAGNADKIRPISLAAMAKSY
jgi:hypothetical protein